jgi:aryl-alcohol dehydrogenase-like predicted oxidoreductase
MGSKPKFLDLNNMQFAGIPGTSVEVSRIAIGTWAIGGWMWGGSEEKESIETIRAAVDRGITVVDTVPVYRFGRSEEIVGKALIESGLRSRAVIATKVGLEWRDGSVFRNASRERITRELEDSLRRLRTDYIDIYQVHWPDPLVPMKEAASAMRSLYEQGKICAVEVSNFSVAQMDAFRRVAPLHVLQSPYNLFERGIEDEILPYCRRNNIAVLGYGALCRARLSGGMRRDTTFRGDDVRKNDPKFQQLHFAQYLASVERLDLLAQYRYGKRVIHLAVRWMLNQGVTVALWGARHPDQLAPVAEVGAGRSNPTSRPKSTVYCASGSRTRWGPSSWRRRRAHRTNDFADVHRFCQRPRKRRCELARLDGFLEQLAHAGVQRLLRENRSAVAAHEHNRQIRAKATHASGELGSGDRRHPLVRHHDLEGLRGLLERLERRTPVGKGCRRVAELGEHLRGHDNERFLVIHEQHPLAVAARHGLARGLGNDPPASARGNLKRAAPTELATSIAPPESVTMP